MLLILNLTNFMTLNRTNYLHFLKLYSSERKKNSEETKQIFFFNYFRFLQVIFHPLYEMEEFDRILLNLSALKISILNLATNRGHVPTTSLPKIIAWYHNMQEYPTKGLPSKWVKQQVWLMTHRLFYSGSNELGSYVEISLIF